MRKWRHVIAEEKVRDRRAEPEYFYRIIFDKKTAAVEESGKRAYSSIFYVPPGKAAVISLYNAQSRLELEKDPNDPNKSKLTEKGCFVLHKLSFGETSEVTRRLQCHELISLRDIYALQRATQRIFHEPVITCKEQWTMDGCNNYKVLTVPGFYMFSQDDMEQLESAYMEVAVMPVEDMVLTPDAIKFGALL